MATIDFSKRAAIELEIQLPDKRIVLKLKRQTQQNASFTERETEKLNKKKEKDEITSVEFCYATLPIYIENYSEVKEDLESLEIFEISVLIEAINKILMPQKRTDEEKKTQ